MNVEFCVWAATKVLYLSDVSDECSFSGVVAGPLRVKTKTGFCWRGPYHNRENANTNKEKSSYPRN